MSFRIDGFDKPVLFNGWELCVLDFVGAQSAKKHKRDFNGAVTRRQPMEQTFFLFLCERFAFFPFVRNVQDGGKRIEIEHPVFDSRVKNCIHKRVQLVCGLAFSAFFYGFEQIFAVQRGDGEQFLFKEVGLQVFVVASEILLESLTRHLFHAEVFEVVGRKGMEGSRNIVRTVGRALFGLCRFKFLEHIRFGKLDCLAAGGDVVSVFTEAKLVGNRVFAACVGTHMAVFTIYGNEFFKMSGHLFNLLVSESNKALR